MSSIWNPEEGSDFLHGSSLEDPLITDPEIEDSTQLLLVLPPLCVCDKYTFKAGHVASLHPILPPSNSAVQELKGGALLPSLLKASFPFVG